MNITIVSQWFPPEHAPIGYMIRELADALATNGHRVTVVTGFPNHPSGAVFPGYKKCWLQQETVGEVTVLRTWLFTSRSRSLLSRACTFLTFTATSAWALLRQTRPHVIFAVFQPLTVGLTLPVVAKLRRSRLVLNVQDLHPDALVSMGVLRNRGLIAVLRCLERFGYRRARALVVICEGFRDHVVKHGARPERVAVIGNWIDTNAVVPGDRDNEMRAALGASKETFIVLHAGTIGHASGAGIIVDAAGLLGADPDIRIAFVGEGPLLPILKAAVASANLRTVTFLPFQSRDRLALVQASCDVAVVSLRPGQGHLSVPSKVLGYMAAGRAVIASVDSDSETARLVEQAACGVVVPAGDAAALAGAIRAVRDDPRRLSELGRNGREYVVKHCSKAVATRRYVEFLSAAAAW
jgi:colanic acid biosynthesis glycosyl transferase WcaI